MCTRCLKKVSATNHTFDSKGYCTVCGYKSRPLTSIVPAKKSYTLGMGEKTVKIRCAPVGGNGKDKITFKSSDTAVVKVNSSTGLLTPVKNGTATVTLSSGKIKTTVTVKVITPTIKVSKTKVKLAVGKSYTVTAALSAETELNSYTWKSQNPDIATVDKNGEITAVKSGTAIIVVKTAGGKKATVKVTVP